MANFCGKCGSPVDPNTGLCPVCNPGPAAGSNATQNFTAATAVTPDTAGKKGKDKNKRAKQTSVLTVAITVLLSICLFFTSLLAFTVFTVRNSVKKDNLQKISEDISYTEAFSAFGAESSLDRFYDYVDEKFGVSIADRDIDRIVRKTSINRFVVNKLSKFCEDFFDDGGRIVLKKDELREQLYKNSDYIEDQTGLDLNEYDYRGDERVGDKIADWIINDDSVTLVKDGAIQDESPALYYIIKLGLSYINFAILLLLSALIIFGLIRNSYSQGLCGSGVVFIILGGTFTVSGLLSMIGSLWETIVGGSFFGVLVGRILQVNIIVSLIILLAGILMLVIRFLIKKFIASRKVKTN